MGNNAERTMGPYKVGTGSVSRKRIYASGGCLIADFNTIEMMSTGSEWVNAAFFAHAGTQHDDLVWALGLVMRHYWDHSQAGPSEYRDWTKVTEILTKAQKVA